MDWIEGIYRGGLIAAVALTGVAAALAWGSDPRRRVQRALRRAPAKPLGAVVAGERVRVRGVAARAERTLEAPFTRRRCFAYRVTVERFGEGSWHEVAVSERSQSFSIVDEGIEVRVEGTFQLGWETDATGDVADGASWSSGLDELSVVGRVSERFKVRHRFLEAALEPGDPLWVLGRASVVVDPSGRRESPRGQPVKRVISGTAREPVIIADEDQPGVLDRFGRA